MSTNTAVGVVVVSCLIVDVVAVVVVGSNLADPNSGGCTCCCLKLNLNFSSAFSN